MFYNIFKVSIKLALLKCSVRAQDQAAWTLDLDNGALMPNATLLPGKKLTSSKLFTNLNSVVFYFLHLLHCYKISRISRSKQTKILKLEFYIFHTFMFRFYFSFRTKFQFTRKENNLNPRENDCVAMVHIFDFEELYLLFLPV